MEVLQHAWHWLVLAMLLIGLELAVPGFVIIWFGFSALFVALILIILPGLSLSLLLFVWASLAMLLLAGWFFLGQPWLKSRNEEQLTTEKVSGKMGIVTEPPYETKEGKVRFTTSLLGSDEWPILSDQSLPLQAGDKVIVIGTDKNRLIVKQYKA